MNGKEGGAVGISSSEQLEIRFEILGNSDIEFGLVLYLNNEPVLIDRIAMVEIDIQNGKRQSQISIFPQKVWMRIRCFMLSSSLATTALPMLERHVIFRRR